MSDLPAWLPDKLSLHPLEAKALQEAYEIFKRDFEQGLPRLNGLPLLWDPSIGSNGYPKGFWHLVSKDLNSYQRDGNRAYNVERAEKLQWFVAITSNPKEQELKVFDYEEGSGFVHTYLWLEKHDYVVVLRKKATKLGDAYQIMSGYHVEAGGRRGLEKKYVKRIKPGGDVKP